MGVIGQYQQGAFTTPVNGTLGDAAEVLSNDNATRTKHNSHDNDATIHVQSSTLAARPAAGTAQRFWVTTDGLRAYVDSGAVWQELAYAATAGTPTFTTLVTFAAGATVSSGQTLTVTGATITGLTAASVGAGTFPSGAFVFQGALDTTGQIHPLTAGNTPILAETSGGTDVYLQLKNTGGSAYIGSSSNALKMYYAGAATLGATLDSSGLVLNSLPVSGITTLAGTGAVSGFTTLDITGAFVAGGDITASGGDIFATSAAGIPRVLLTATTGTNSASYQLSTTGGVYYFGVESSTSSIFGATAYAQVIYAPVGRNVEILANGATKAIFSSSGVNFNANPLSNITTLAGTGAISGFTTIAMSSYGNFGGNTSTYPFAVKVGTNLNLGIRDSSGLNIVAINDALGATVALSITASSLSLANAGAVTFGGAVSGITTLAAQTPTFTGASAGALVMTITANDATTTTDLIRYERSGGLVRGVLRFNNANKFQFGATTAHNLEILHTDAVHTTFGASGAVTFTGALSGITTLAGTGAISGFTTMTTGGAWILTGSSGGVGGSNRYIGSGGSSTLWLYNVPTGGTHSFQVNEGVIGTFSAAGLALNTLALSGLTTLAGSGAVSGFTTMNFTGDLGTTGARITKGWFTDLESTNAIAASITGSAPTLTTTRTIWGQNFNGSANVTGAGSGFTTLAGTDAISGFTSATLSSFMQAASARTGTGTQNTTTGVATTLFAITTPGTYLVHAFNAAAALYHTVTAFHDGTNSGCSGDTVGSGAPGISISGTNITVQQNSGSDKVFTWSYLRIA